MSGSHGPPEEADPLIALWGERSRAAVQLRALGDDVPEPVASGLIEALVGIDDRIAAAVPLSATGMIVQLRVLREHLDSDPFAEKIVDNLVAALARTRLDVRQP